MHVSVDNDKCTGHARCFATSPAIFTLDDVGFSNIGKGKLVPEGHEQEAIDGVNACPEGALTIDD
jgi:ferredoxin